MIVAVLKVGVRAWMGSKMPKNLIRKNGSEYRSDGKAYCRRLLELYMVIITNVAQFRFACCIIAHSVHNLSL